MNALKCLAASLVFAVLVARPVTAAGWLYLLDGTASQVGFSADFGQDEITGRFPVSAARLQLDFRDVSKSAVSVTLDAASAVASFPFAAQAMKGPNMLDTRTYPTISFQSTAVTQAGAGAIIDGDLTVRGVTRSISLQAMLWRSRGSDPGDLDHLVIRLTGVISRSAYGASGWPDAVGDEVRLDIFARVSRVNEK